jgi:hypothetical protein
MTQDVFDALAITHAMLRLGANPSVLNKGSFSGAIEIYKQSYPDEDFQVVLTDLPAATHEVERIADDVYDAFFKGSSSDKKSAYYAVLKELRKIVKQQSQEKRPLTKANILAAPGSITNKARCMIVLKSARRMCLLRLP